MAGAMTLFLSTFVNKVDKKGRVSVPAQFRLSLAQQSFNGIVAFPSFTSPSIEAGGIDRMERLSAGAADLPTFSPEQDDLTTLIFASAQQLAFDPEGRVILPEELTSHAGITETAAFVGLGRTFQIWEPKAFNLYRSEALARAKANRPVLPSKTEGNGP
jgi:MraZ protein